MRPKLTLEATIALLLISAFCIAMGGALFVKLFLLPHGS